jgi:molybdate transport system substrate-binding protein
MRRRALLALAPFATPALAQTPALAVFADVSLQDALRAFEPAWRAAAPGNLPLRFSFGASSALARQIEQGAPADLFASADEESMDWLAQRDLIEPTTRISPIGNSLVLVGPVSMQVPAGFQLTRGTDLRALLGASGRIAVGDPPQIPGGRYAQAALTWLGQWAMLAPRLARAENTRSALLLVERGEAPLGIVHATDAKATNGVRMLASFPPASHPPIAHPFAVTRRAAANQQALALHGFLTGAPSARTWRRFGFTMAG